MKKEWVILFVSFFTAFSYLFALQSYPPIIPQVMEEFALSYTAASLLMSLVTLAGIFLSLPAWVFIFKWGLKKVGALSLALCTLGGLVTFLSGSFLMLGLGRAILGVGGALINIISFAMVPLWFPRKHRGKAMGIKGLDMPVATVVALNFLPLVAASYGWRASFAASTLLLLASTAVFILLFEDRPLGNSAAKMFEGLWNRQMWLLGAVWCFVNMGTIAYSTWAGTFFLQLKGVPAHLAFFMAGILMLTALPLNPVVGTLSDRLGKRKIFITLSMALMGVSFTLIAFLSLPLLFSAVVLLGFSAFYAPVIFASTSELLPEEKAGLGFSILFTCGFAGTFLGPFLVGYIQDAFPGGTPSFLAMAVFSVSALMCSRLLKVR